MARKNWAYKRLDMGALSHSEATMAERLCAADIRADKVGRGIYIMVVADYSLCGAQQQATAHISQGREQSIIKHHSFTRKFIAPRSDSWLIDFLTILLFL